MREFFVRTSFLYVRVTRKKAGKTTFVRKTRAYNVDEIDGRLAQEAQIEFEIEECQFGIESKYVNWETGGGGFRLLHK
jgi:hypothetical protein